MSWVSENYHVGVVATRHPAPLHDWQAWRLLMPHLDPIVEMADGAAAVRSFQVAGRGKWLTFGRMAWNARDNEKWCTRYRSDPDIAPVLRFSSTEVWAPGWSVIEREHRALDVFIRLQAERHADNLQGLTIAVRSVVAERQLLTLHRCIESLRGLIPDAVAVEFVRSWAGRGAWINGLLDTSASELLDKAPGPHESRASPVERRE